MKMKYARLAVFVETKKGKLYQVALDEEQRGAVSYLLLQLHQGRIKVLDKQFETLSFGNSKKRI